MKPLLNVRRFYHRYAGYLLALAVFGIIVLVTYIERGPKRIDRRAFFNNYAAEMITNSDKVVIYPALYVFWLSTNPATLPPDPEREAGPGVLLPSERKREIVQMFAERTNYVWDTNYSMLSVFSPDAVLMFRHNSENLRCVLSIGSGEAVFYADSRESYFDVRPMRQKLAAFTKPYLPIIPPTWYDLTN